MSEPLRPLSVHARAELREALRHATPCCTVNPGVIEMLVRRGLAEVVPLPSPFKTHKAKLINHLQITEAGRAALAEYRE